MANISAQDSKRDADAGFFQGASHVNASNGVFNQVGRDQYNYNSAVNNDIVVRRFHH
jgi:hypothetical protein